MKIAVLLPAAGLGKRFNEAAPAGTIKGSGSKIELDLAGRPVFLRAIELFLKRPGVEQILLAVNPDTVEDFRFRWGDKLGFHGVDVVPGGTAERWETVHRALTHVRPGCTHVAIHDAARPLASPALLDRVFQAATKYDAVIPGLPAAATLKRVEDVPDSRRDLDPLDAILGGAGRDEVRVRRVVATLDRRDVVEVQTPQVFEINLLRRAYDQITMGVVSGAGITDDAGLVEALGQPVHVVEGEVLNFKITRPDDLRLATAWVLSQQQQTAGQMARKRLFADDDE